MDSSPSSTSLISCKKFKSENHTPKKRKVNDDEKTVVRVKVGTKKGDQEQKNEGPPPDSWSWRKYGQKPISGSPYPRGYYRCSTTKGCLAKKQVERSKEDSSILIITYTSAHNHPRPKWAQNNIPKKNRARVSDPAHTGKAQSEPRTPEQACNNKGKDGHFPYMQSPNGGKMLAKVEEDEPYMVTLDSSTPDDSLDNFYMVNKLPHTKSFTFTTSRAAEESSDFYDELEELSFSTSSSFTSLGRNNDLILPS